MRTLDRTRKFATIFGDFGNAAFSQDGRYFDRNGQQIDPFAGEVRAAPAAVEVAPVREPTVAELRAMLEAAQERERAEAEAAERAREAAERRAEADRLDAEAEAAAAAPQGEAKPADTPAVPDQAAPLGVAPSAATAPVAQVKATKVGK